MRKKVYKDPLIVGFTGTRKHLTKYQHKVLTRNLIKLYKDGARHFHHGDCLGADAIAHDIAVIIGYDTYIHPPKDSKHRVWKRGTFEFPPKAYMTRNQDIVDAATILIAVPAQDHEIIRSGTWATVRKARKKQIPITIFYPQE